jgi:Fe-S-cluster containining protein
MSYLSQNQIQKQADQILDQFQKISDEFSSFQKETKLDCLAGCGRCCFKTDIHCTPIELLPLALEILKRNEAESFLDKVIKNEKGYCIFLDIKDHSKYQATCSEYKFRPLVCRTFGVSARNGKNGRIDFSVCKTIKENKEDSYQDLLNKQHLNDALHMPYIDLSHRKLSVIDPRFLEETFPINTSFKLILEKVLLMKTYLEIADN